MTDMCALPVVSMTEVGSRQALVVLDVEQSPVRASHTIPGQYVKAALWRDDVPRPYAVASRPGAAWLELLVKLPGREGGEGGGDEGSAERRAALLSLLPGEKLQVSRTEGRGYPLSTLSGQDVWLFGVGTGIAPLRSAVETMIETRTDFGDIVVVYGVQRPDDLAFKGRFGHWAGHLVRVIPVVSRPGDSGWAGATGYVQDQLPRGFTHPERTHALVCGLPEMDRLVSAMLLERGVGPDRVHRNW